MLARMTDEHKLEIDLFRVFSDLDTEAKRVFIKRLSLQNDIIHQVIDYICGEDADGCWTSEEPQLRQKLLDRVEKAHIAELSNIGPLHGWHVWSEIQHKLKTILNTKEVYWALVHDDLLRDQSHNFFKRHGIASNYTTEAAYAHIEEVKTMIIEGFKKMVPAKVKAPAGEECPL